MAAYDSDEELFGDCKEAFSIAPTYKAGKMESTSPTPPGKMKSTSPTPRGKVISTNPTLPPSSATSQPTNHRGSESPEDQAERRTGTPKTDDVAQTGPTCSDESQNGKGTSSAGSVESSDMMHPSLGASNSGGGRSSIPVASAPSGVSDQGRTSATASATISRAAANDDEDEDDDDECSVCSESRRYLKMLPCGHCFCEYCLQQIVNQFTTYEQSGDAFPCPHCRAVTRAPSRGASDFPFHVPGRHKRALKVEQLVETLREGPERGTVAESCQQCGLEVSGYRCYHCRKLLCEFCRQEHRSAGHLLLALPSFGQQHVDPEGPHGSECLEHAHELRHYCTVCQELLCNTCMQDHSGKHKRLYVVTLSQASVQAREKLTETRGHVDQFLRQLQLTLEDVLQQQQDLGHNMNRMEDRIRAKALDARALVDLHEKKSLAFLKDAGQHLGRKMIDNVISAESKTAAVTAILAHIDRVLMTASDAECVRIQVSASETVAKTDYFDKFTSDLPDSMHMELPPGSVDQLAEAVDAYMGNLTISTTPRELPLVKVLERHAFQADQPGFAWFVCPVGERMAWLGTTDKQKVTTIALCNLDTGTVVKQQVVPGGLCMARIDEHLVLAQKTGQAELLCLDGDNISYQLERDYRHIAFITNKGKVWASLHFSNTGDTKPVLKTDLSYGMEAMDTSRGRNKTSMTLSEFRIPLNMDVSRDRKFVAVVDDRHKLYMYKVKSHKVVLKKTMVTSTNAVEDACFYFLGKEEVLLVADRTKDDVIVVDFNSRKFKELGYLTSNTGVLRHPSALEVHPSTGHLYVACEGRSIVVCGATGVKVVGQEGRQKERERSVSRVSTNT